jgi:uncharacterized repeat protein (TIGR01451 family)
VQKKEVFLNDTGEEEKRLVPAEKVLPGETVYYTITFTNTSDEVADNVVVTNPIAEELMYLDGSAFGPGMEIVFSVDGGETFAVADELNVTDNGETRAAEAKGAVCGNFGMREALTRQLRLGAGFAGICKK